MFGVMQLTESQIAHVRDLLLRSGDVLHALKYLDEQLGGVGVSVAAEHLNELTERFNADSNWKYIARFRRLAVPHPSAEQQSNVMARSGEPMFVYRWWRPDRYIASISAGEDEFDFPRYYFVREVLGTVAEHCLADDELELIQTPYEYGIDFIELTRDQQITLESRMKGIPPNKLAAAFRTITNALESDLETWNSELGGDANEYIRVLTAADAFLQSKGSKNVFWSVHYDE